MIWASEILIECVEITVLFFSVCGPKYTTPFSYRRYRVPVRRYSRSNREVRNLGKILMFWGRRVRPLFWGSRVNIRLKPKEIAQSALTALMGHGESQKKKSRVIWPQLKQKIALLQFLGLVGNRSYFDPTRGWTTKFLIDFFNYSHHRTCGKIWWRSAQRPPRLDGEKSTIETIAAFLQENNRSHGGQMTN